MSDFLLLEIPEFRPKYKKKVRYGFSGAAEKRNLKEVLYKAGYGYCMYCYTRILIDGKQQGQLEHAIEKLNSDKLINCVPDIGISCAVCNNSLKKRGEAKRKLCQKDIEEFERAARCSADCIKGCKALINLQTTYSLQKSAEIILQPMGVTGCDSLKPMRLQYDVLNAEFIPSKVFDTYSDSEVEFIQNHILRFNLNDVKLKSRQLIDFVRDVIDNDGKIAKRESNNLIVDLFVARLKGQSPETIMKICKTIYSISILKFN